MTADYRYVALFDILGFSNLVESAAIGEVARVFGDFRDLLDSLQDGSGLGIPDSDSGISYLLFSDTVVVHSRDTSPRSLYSILVFSSTLLGFAFARGVLLRGALTAGEVHVTPNTILGAPIVEAHRMEGQQEWVGCWVHEKCLAYVDAAHIANLETGFICRYRVPLKTGPAVDRVALNWGGSMCIAADDRLPPPDQPEFGDRVRSLFYTLSDETRPSWEAERKFANTLNFLRFSARRDLARWDAGGHMQGFDEIEEMIGSQSAPGESGVQQAHRADAAS